VHHIPEPWHQHNPATLDGWTRLALARFSVLVACPGDMIAKLDLNPVIAGAEGVLVEPNA